MKNVVNTNVELKKLVYTFLTQYTEVRQDDALLAINSFQKDLSNDNPFIRALALRVMTNIRLPDIVQLMVLAVEKCAKDPSAYVRKVAAIALPKIFSLEPDQKEMLEGIIQTLLCDTAPMVLSG